ncbi:MAG: Hsp20/alpha crystallin family protein [Spirochaetes bacterium]|nr:Hsp20/alpha crystallin family protein [Spirochaetota bacterium]
MFYTYDVLDDVIRMGNAFEKFFGNSNVRRHYPYINMYEENDKVTLKSVMPGVSVEDITIELVDNSVVIKGERKSLNEKTDFVRNERNFGCFNKSVRLPYEVDRDNIKAVLKDGILTVELLKSEAAKPKKIEIK